MTRTTTWDGAVASRYLAILAAFAVVLALFPLAGAANAQATDDDEGTANNVSVQRLRGVDRFGTARVIAADAFPDADTVIIASGQQFPDALAGSFLAGAFEAPVLLVARTTTPNDTLSALNSLGDPDLIVLGGVNAIGNEVRAALEANGSDIVDEYSGATRFETAAEIATSGETVGTFDGDNTAIVATGQAFADALVAGTVSYSENFPILLTPSNTLHPAAEAALNELDIERVIIPGGPAAVSAAVESQIRATGATVTRVFVPGGSRFDTSVAFAEFAADNFDYSYDEINVATGFDFADALTLAPRAGRNMNPLILTNGTQAQPVAPVINFLTENACEIESLVAAGGPNAISEANLNALAAAASDCDDATPPATPPTTPAPTPGTESTIQFDAASSADETIIFGQSRTFTATGLAADGCYRVTLLANSAFEVQEDGAVQFTGERVDGRNLTVVGDLDARIDQVNGESRTPARTFGALRPAANGTISFRAITANTAEAFTPVIYFDGACEGETRGGEVTRLELDADGFAIQAFGLAGSTTVTAPVVAQGVTVRPELASATIVGTVATGQATGTNPAGTTVRYTFDEPVVFTDFTLFKVFRADNDSETGSAFVSSADGGRSVLIRFSALTAATGTSATSAAQLTLATVEFGAVVDSDGRENPEGDAAIGAGSTGEQVGQAGRTSAPDLVRVSGFREGAVIAGVGGAPANPNTTAVDFTFDQPAFIAATDDGDSFSLVLTTTAPGAFAPTVIDCDGPNVGGSPPPASGGTGPGGDGTTTITVLCANPVGQTTPITVEQTARGAIEDGTVQNQATTVIAPAAFTNANQTADVAPGTTTTGPDLIAARFLQPTAGPDTVVFTFDQDINPASIDDSFFRVYFSNGEERTNGTLQVVSANNREVAIDFSRGAAFNPPGTDTFGGAVRAVGASVLDDAVQGANAIFNARDERGVENLATAGERTAGRTAAPNLLSVTLDRAGAPFEGQGAFRATYTFDQAVGGSSENDPDNAAFELDGTTAAFKLFLADGTQLVATDCRRFGATTDAGATQVRCTAFGAATNAQVGNATLGTTAFGAVQDQTAGSANPNSPEGAAFTTGGTGVPRQS